MAATSPSGRCARRDTSAAHIPRAFTAAITFDMTPRIVVGAAEIERRRRERPRQCPKASRLDERAWKLVSAGMLRIIMTPCGRASI